MVTLNGDDAVAAMNARTTNVPGTCLATVWAAYGSHPSIGPHAGQYPDAIDGWRYATRQHPGDPKPPAGYPVYFDALTRPRYAGDTNYAAGDVVISLGGGLVRCTDGAGAGRMGTMTIAQRAAQIGRTYLGWTEDFLGYDIVTAAAAAVLASPLSATPNQRPTNPPEDDMTVYLATTASTDGVVPNGWMFVQDAEGPLRAVDSLEAGNYLFKEKYVPNYIISRWAGDDIRSLIARVGLRGFAPIITGLKDTAGNAIQGPGKLNGTITY
jgi:hypothetical protein